MTPEEACPFCNEPAIRQTIQGVAFRCGTLGPDINGEYSTGHVCDIATYNRLLAEKEKEVERLLEKLRTEQLVSEQMQREIHRLDEVIRYLRETIDQNEHIPEEPTP